MERPDGIKDGLTRRGLLASAAGLVWAWPRKGSEPPGGKASFRLENAGPAGGSAAAVFSRSFIDHDPALPYVHCPSVCVRRDGRILCAWYAGSREGARDVAVWVSESSLPGEGAEIGRLAWSPPRVVIDRGLAARQLGRFVNKVGNPVIFTDADDRVWIVFVTIAVGGWSGSSLNACVSDDGGRSWSPARRLSLSPFFNISELVRAAPAMLSDGAILLPVYHECIGKFPEIAWLEPEGDHLVATKSRMAGGREFLQPAVVPLGERAIAAFLRDHSSRHRVFFQHSTDAGETWSPPVATKLRNLDASIASVRLSDGRILLAVNDSEMGRERLSLVVSQKPPPADSLDAWAMEGEWRRIATLDHEPGERFAYPFMVRDALGLIHLVFSWKMKRVSHTLLNEAWISSRQGEAAS